MKLCFGVDIKGNVAKHGKRPRSTIGRVDTWLPIGIGSNTEPLL
jgi:hypothetical protein